MTQLTSLTAQGTIQWKRQVHSTHQYGEWNDALLVLGPSAEIEDHQIPRFLDSSTSPVCEPQWQEINSNDPNLRDSWLTLVDAVEATPLHLPLTDIFALTDERLKRFKK